MDTVAQPADRALYEADEHAWIARQIDALRSGRLENLDRDSLVEYLTDMTIRDRRELKSRFIILLQHLLKLRMQPERPARSWVLAILSQQASISDLLGGISSMATHAPDLFDEAYAVAVRLAAAETRIPAQDFRPQSPWTMQQALASVPPDLPAPAIKRRGAAQP
jgi:Domain of unknown function DUF29